MAHKKKNLSDCYRPMPCEFGVSRYMERDGNIYMLDNKDGKVYLLSNWFWDKPEKELHSLRTREILKG